MALVETNINEGVMTITLCDEERRNALSQKLLEELVAAIDLVDGDPDIRVAVLTNRGKVFCAGADLNERSTGPENDDSKSATQLGTLLQRIRLSPKPFVGRIAGHCVAGGVGIAAAMDISIAIDTAMFGFTEVRVGVVPAVISVVCLPKMRLADAQSAFLRGDRFGSREAATIGLINMAVTAEELDGEVSAAINDLLEGEPHAIAVAKQLTSLVPSLSMREAFESMAVLSSQMFQSPEALEGMTAYLEKRPASWVRHVTQNESSS
jgi:methylglutaconyl-CoA hydratase